MSDNDTLLAHLVPALTPQVEVAATKSLAFILNKSEPCRLALNSLVENGDLELNPITHTAAEVEFEGGGRVDVVCYHADDDYQLLIEAKFWASLGEDQASAYFGYLDRDRPGVLMILAPDRRVEAIWPEALAQVRKGGANLQELDSPGRSRLARCTKTQRRLMFVSWAQLLDRLREGNDPTVASDIEQLRGLAQKQDEEVPLPLHPESLRPEVGRRIGQFHRIVDDASERANKSSWFEPTSRAASPYRGGYGRGFKPSGWQNAAWFGFEYGVWGVHGRSPLWVQVDIRDWPSGLLPVEALDDPYGRRHLKWIPIDLKLGAEHDEVITDVVAQLKRIVDRS